ncbi:Dipeptidase 1 [Holothuria leucospilota]|uniref:Dipeptidase n=1 Tax=Holothuria leucospilota TaxID=206669 RepID=A0A9Q1HDL2_HOLLE|nr:Dipeptidase 1 [Holothuria leucospilota]
MDRGAVIAIAVTVTVVVVAAIAVAIAVPLSKRDEKSDVENRELAEQWMSETPLIDGHNDLPWFLKNNHDNRLEDIDLSVNISEAYDITHTDIPRLRAGKVGAQFWAAYTSCNSQYKDAVTHVLDQIDVIKRMCKKYPEDFEFVTSAQGIIDAFEAGKIGGLIGVEGGHNIDSFPSVMRMLAELGVRYMTMTHSCNTPWADNWLTDSEEEVEFDGLTDWGEKLVLEMNRIGVFVDLSHVSKATMLEALEVSRAPVIFSHSSAFSICGSYRNVQDDVFPAIRENGGVIMVNFYTRYINCPPLNISNNIDEAELFQVADHIDYLAQNCGYDNVGIGGDYDGVDYVPNGLEDVSKYPDLIAELIRRGWGEVNIKKLLGDNLLRAMRRMEEVRDEMANDLPLEENMPRDSGGEANNQCRTYYYDSTN